jgi:hypothetical protein
MKWREPWRETLKRQPSLRLLSRPNLWNALIWTAAFGILLVISVATGQSSLGEVALRSWVAPVFGFGVACLLALLHWLSPFEIISGPRGIVRSKGEVSALIPWSAIRAYRLQGSGVGRVLELEVSYAAEPERLYLPSKISAVEIEAEIRSHLRIETSPRPPRVWVVVQALPSLA